MVSELIGNGDSMYRVILLHTVGFDVIEGSRIWFANAWKMHTGSKQQTVMK